MSGVEVLIPWQDIDCPHRAKALGYVMGRWEADGYPIRLCSLANDVPWCKAAALAPAMADPPPVLIVADADCVVDPLMVAECVQVVRDGDGWGIPHWQVQRLTRAATEHLIATGEVQAECERSPYLGVATGGVVVISAAAAASCPMDGTYEGWGGEDYSWGLALDTLVDGPYRPARRTDLVHLWHPGAPRSGQGTNVSSDEDRRHAYFSLWAVQDVDGMRRLVEGGRVWPASKSS